MSFLCQSGSLVRTFVIFDPFLKTALSEIYAPSLPASTATPTLRTRNGVHDRSGMGQKRGSGREVLEKQQTVATERVTTHSGKFSGDQSAEVDDEEEPDYIDPNTGASDWGDFGSGYGASLTISHTGLTALISLHCILLP